MAQTWISDILTSWFSQIPGFVVIVRYRYKEQKLEGKEGKLTLSYEAIYTKCLTRYSFGVRSKSSFCCLAMLCPLWRWRVAIQCLRYASRSIVQSHRPSLIGETEDVGIIRVCPKRNSGIFRLTTTQKWAHHSKNSSLPTFQGELGP